MTDIEKPELELRLATTTDQDGVIALVSSVLSEYGETICLDRGGAEFDLQTIDEAYFQRGGAFWVFVNRTGGEIVGTHSATPVNSDTCVLKRLYLDARYRRSGYGFDLMKVAVDWVRQNGFKRIEFWSDVRFERAHQFFEDFGFDRTGESRTMQDSFEPYTEYRFTMDLKAQNGLCNDELD